MRRWIKRCLICAVLGLVTSVGVAWGIAATGMNYLGTTEVIGIGGAGLPGDWMGTVLFDTGQRDFALLTISQMRGIPFIPPGGLYARPRLEQWVLSHFDERPEQSYMAYIHGSGWPMICLSSAAFTGGPPTMGGVRTDWGIRLWSTASPINRGMRTLPLRPVGLGLAVNALLYGLLWMGLFRMPGIVRRALRSREGLCPNCRYDLRGLPDGAVCPECGSDRSGGEKKQ